MEKLNKKYVLKIEGHYQDNSNYYEEFNTNTRINKELLLEEGKQIEVFGCKILINKIYDNYIEVLINDEMTIELEPNISKSLIGYQNTSGKNENFTVTSKSLYISLVESELVNFDNLNNYLDVKPRLDENIKKVEFLLGYQRTYFAIQNTLKSVLFRLTNEQFLGRINKNNDEQLLKEYNTNLPYKETIIQIIEDIDTFELENIKLLNSIIQKRKMSSYELRVLLPYLTLLAEDNSSHDKIDYNIVEKLCFGRSSLYNFEEVSEGNILNNLLVKIKAKTRYFFEFPYITEDLLTAAKWGRSLDFNIRIEYAFTAGDYYLSIYNRDKAMECYELASKIAFENNDLETSAYALQKYYRINNYYPEERRKKFDINLIEEKYKEYSKIVIQGINSKVLKVDPIEFSINFISDFTSVMREVEREINEVGDLHIPQQRWELMKKAYAKRYVNWRTPAEMNPKVKFD